MDPWKSWAIVGVVGAGAAYYYSQSGKSKRGRDRASSLQVGHAQRYASDARNDSKDTRKKKGKAKAPNVSDQNPSEAAESSSGPSSITTNDRAKKRKGSKQQPSKLAQSSAVDVSKEREAQINEAEGDDEEMSNKEFAQQLMGLKSGTSLKKPATTENESRKMKKQGKNKELPSHAANDIHLQANDSSKAPNLSTTSSTTGADADDDLSLPVSPDLGATQATTPSGGDVSDMLEAPSKGPSVLRITQSATSQPAKQTKAKKAAQEPETKKQRQNRQKNEEKKALREQAEKERRILLEKQLRTAREAEGRPAKNGLSTSKSPAVNAWDKPSTLSAQPATSPQIQSSRSDNGGLLDTFDEDKSFLDRPTTQTNGGVNNDTTDDGKTRNRDLLSEEEQMKMLSEIDDDRSWNTVGKGGKGKKKSTKAASNKKGTPAPPNNFSPSTNGKTTSDSDNLSTSGYPPSESLTSNPSEDLVNDKMDESPSVHVSHEERFGHEGGAKEGTRQGLSYTGYVPPAVSKRWRAIAKNLDRNIWNYDNIHEHPEYDPEWPFALTGHPKDSDWVDDWSLDDMRRADEKRTPKKGSSQNAQRV
ncbi:hypothetical protein ACLMJK_004217 [Lecanora helva]